MIYGKTSSKLKSHSVINLLIIALAVTLASLIACSNSDTQAEGMLKPIDQSYAQYGQLLADYVHNGFVDYTGLKRDRALLDSVVNMIATADTSGMTRDQLKAFYINAYNILTLRSIVDAYPVKSIKDIDDVWKKKWRVAGEKISLDEIENKILREKFKDPRIHMAINCASKSCPPLRSDPYVADSLDQQLEDASDRFVSDDRYNRIYPEKAKAELSRVFDWFGTDFVDQYYDHRKSYELSPEKNAVLMFAIKHHPKRDQAALLVRTYEVTFLDYDWSLNDASQPSGDE